MALYLDTSAVLRALLETGTTPEVERRIRDAGILLTSRLSCVEASRALIRLGQLASVPERRLTEARRDVQALWDRCELWELTPAVCELAGSIAPPAMLRTLDALHLATYMLARREIPGVELLTADKRLSEAAAAV